MKNAARLARIFVHDTRKLRVDISINARNHVKRLYVFVIQGMAPE